MELLERVPTQDDRQRRTAQQGRRLVLPDAVAVRDDAVTAIVDDKRLPILKCNICRRVRVPVTKQSRWSDELQLYGWIARPIAGSYQHACADCAPELIAM